MKCLHSCWSGIAIENPRQQSAYRYSSRYGPIAPSFSRARRVAAPAGESGDRLLISGTASIVGEDSTHRDDTSLQLTETLANIDALIQAAGGSGRQSLENLRVYYTPHTSRAALQALLPAHLDEDKPAIEYRPVALCRRELIVEIEGIAVLDSTGSTTASLPTPIRAQGRI